MTILDKIAAATAMRVEKAKAQISAEEMKARAKSHTDGFPFEKALRTGDIAFICEVKKASPSKGLITPHFPYLQIAMEYERAGANAISVLTEPDFFMGDNAYLDEIKRTVGIPVLRKDFIIDEYQIYEATAIGADAVLLICSLLSGGQIREYIGIADALGLSCLVETHDSNEVQMAVEAGARIIGVNNRDLKTFEVDINNSISLRKLVPPEIIFVSESGIKTAGDVSRLRENGTNAVLIGEALMISGDIHGEIGKLRGALT